MDRSRFAYQVVYLLHLPDGLEQDLERSGIPTRLLGGGLGPRWPARLRRLVKDLEIDLVHVHSPYAAAGARLALSRRIPLVYTEHSVWQMYHPATYWANMLTFPRNDHVFAVSDHVRLSLRYPGPLRVLRMPSVETLYHGIDPISLDRFRSADGVREELGLPDRAPIVGTVAQFRPEKGHVYLLEAAAIVRRAYPEARFVLVGDGPTGRDIRRRAQELGLDGSVVFTGGRSDAPRITAACDIFVLPSIHEGISIALLEAAALGKPCVVTRAGGVPELIEHGSNGLIVPPRSPKALAEGISTLLADPGLRVRLGNRSRKRAAGFDIRKAVRRVEAVYEELLV